MIQKYMKEEELQCYGGVKTPAGILPSSLTSAAQSEKKIDDLENLDVGQNVV